MRRMRSPCCARVDSGNIAAPPKRTEKFPPPHTFTQRSDQGIVWLKSARWKGLK